MKNSLLLIISIFTIMFTACGSDDDNNNGGGTTETSFIVKNTNDAEYKNMVVGYFTKEGKCKKITTIGNMVYNQTSSEIKVIDPNITEVYLFITRGSGDSYKIIPSYKLEKNKKNALNITENIQTVSVKENDDTQYPH